MGLLLYGDGDGDVAVPVGLQKRLMFLRTINVVRVRRTKCVMHVTMSEAENNVTL